MTQKTILELNSDEFKNFIKVEENKRNKRSMLKTAILDMRYAINNREATMDRFTQQEIGVLTVMGLISLFGLSGNQTPFIKFCLWFSFPFFVLSIVFFFIASKRMHVNILGSTAASENSVEELLSLRTNAIHLNNYLTRLIDFCYKILSRHRYQILSAKIFITTFIVYYYLNNIYSVLLDSVMGFIISTIISLFFLWLNFRKKQDWLVAYDVHTGIKSEYEELLRTK